MPQEIDKIAFIELGEGQILTTRSRGKEKFYIPGGKREPGESDEEALVREVLEELNVKVDESTIEYVGTFRAQAHGQEEGVVVKMTCYKASYEGTPEPNSEIEEIKWLNYKDMSLVSYVDEKIFNYLREMGQLR